MQILEEAEAVILTLGNASPPLNFTLAADNFTDEACLNVLKDTHPDYRLFRTIVEWGRGVSAPYISKIEATGQSVRIEFYQADTTAMHTLMLFFFVEVNRAAQQPPETQ